jgi:hypothetical protein
MSAEDISKLYENLSDEDLTQLLVADYDVTQAILSAYPEMAQDAGFELFDASWAKRYWRSIAAEITGIKASDKLLSWAVGATISGTASLLITYFGLPAVAFSSAVALAIIILRAAKNASKPAEKPAA